MKSKIVKLWDYKSIPFEKNIKIECPDEYVEAKLNAAARKNKSVIKADTVGLRDVVTLDMESGNPYYNRKGVKLTAGSHLFDEELEDILPGKKLNETFLAEIDGVRVKAVATDIERAVYPEVTEEILSEYVKSKPDYKGIASIAEFKKFVREQYIEEKKQEAKGEIMQQLCMETLSSSEFSYDDSEVEAIKAETIKEINGELKSYNLTYDKLTDEDCRNIFYIDSLTELKEAVDSEPKEIIATCLWLLAMNGKNPEECTIDDAYNLGMGFIEDYIKNAITFEEV